MALLCSNFKRNFRLFHLHYLEEKKKELALMGNPGAYFAGWGIYILFYSLYRPLDFKHTFAFECAGDLDNDAGFGGIGTAYILCGYPLGVDDLFIGRIFV